MIPYEGQKKNHFLFLIETRSSFFMPKTGILRITGPTCIQNQIQLTSSYLQFLRHEILDQGFMNIQERKHNHVELRFSISGARKMELYSHVIQP